MMVAQPLSRMLGIAGYLKHVFNVTNWNEEELISQLVGFSDRARKEGLLALEDNLDSVEDEFMRKGIQLVVDGTDPDIIIKHSLRRFESAAGAPRDRGSKSLTTGPRSRRPLV